MDKFLDLIKKYKYLILGGVIILIVVVIGIIFYFFKEKEVEVVNEKVVDIIEEEKKIEEEIEVEENITVDVKGEVVKPGVYKLPIGSRVIDAIEISGGTTYKADTSNINLSKVLSDENVIIVYNKYSEQAVKYVEKECNCDVCINDSDVSSNSSTNEKISINKATKEELMSISGIGESRALDIINYRNENGLFKSIEDLKQVSGIGDKLFEQIKDQVTI